MKKLLLVSVATAALIGANGLSLAQAPSEKPNAPAAQSIPAEAAPTGKLAPAEKTAPPMNRTEAPTAKSESGTKGHQADQKMPADKGAAQHVQEQKKDAVQPNRANSEAAPGMKPTGKSSADMKANGKPISEKSASEMNEGKSKDGKTVKSKSATETKSSTTTGQAGAGSKQMTTEQRTTIRTVIREQRVRPVQNVNFSISIGTRVPRTVSFYPLPRQLVSIYPDWRGYRYFLVGDEIIVVNPRTFEIVAVLEA